MLRTRLFHVANYINDLDNMFAYLEVLRAENAGNPGAWNVHLNLVGVRQRSDVAPGAFC